MAVNLFELFTGKERIAGLEISESKLRLAFLDIREKEVEIGEAKGVHGERAEGRAEDAKGRKRTKKARQPVVEVWREVELPEGVIQEGKLCKREEFLARLRALLSESPRMPREGKGGVLRLGKRVRGFVSRLGLHTKPTYVVVSLPSALIYTSIFDFPGRMTYEKLEESMQVTIGFYLPLPESRAYLDWEEVISIKRGKREVLLAMGEKNVISPFLEAITEAGFSPVACESHVLSLARAIHVPHQKPVLIVLVRPEGVSSFILEEGAVRFSRFLPHKRQSVFQEKNGVDAVSAKEDAGGVVAEEAWRTIRFFETEDIQNPRVEEAYLVGVPSTGPSSVDGLASRLEKELGIPVKERWIAPHLFIPWESAKLSYEAPVVLGAALRGLIPRTKDTRVSLMPVGTEEAYEQKKLLAFVDFAGTWVISTSIFFLALFTGAFTLLTLIEQGIIGDPEGRTIFHISEEVAELEKTAQEFNRDIAAMAAINTSTPRWSRVFDEVEKSRNPGITVREFIILSRAEPITVRGIAENRERLSEFRRNLGNSQMFTSVSLPTETIAAQENIHFIITFSLRDPGVLLPDYIL